MTAQTPRKYSSRSQQTTLSSLFTSGATIMPVVSGTALLGGISAPTGGQTFTVVIDPDTSLEEIVDVTGVSGNNFTVTRAVDGSSAQDHSAGAVVRHMVIGRDLREANSHEVATTGVHGLSNTSSVVGTQETQTLYNKTLIAPVLTSTNEADSGITFEGATVDSNQTFLGVVDPTQDNTITLPNTSGTVILDSATQTLTNKTLTSPTIGGTPVITGLSSVGMSTTSATPKNYVDSILGSATAASTSAASAATSASSALASQTAAATSATSAAASATAAATSATSAAASATAAATSATSSANSATAAAASAVTAGSYVSTIAASATAAATSATSAAASATAAATSATSSATSASAALTSANSAATSAASAATSATSSATSASSSLATYNTYKTYYLGAFASAPTLDNQGNALINGATYWNTTNTTMYTYSTGTSTWYAVSTTSGYTAPTLGTTTLTSGATISTVAGLTLTLPHMGNAIFGLTNVPVSGGTTNLSSSDNQQIYFTANGGNNSHTVVLPNTATLAVGEYFDLTNITHLGTNANIAVNAYGGTNLVTMYPSQSVVATVLSTSSNTSGAWNIFYDGSSTASGSGAAVFSTSPTLVTPTLGAASGTSLALAYSGSSSNQGSLGVGGNMAGGPDTGLIATFIGNAATYAYNLTQNTSSGATAYTTNTVANNGFTAYINTGVNSTTYNYSTAGYPNNAFGQANANYIEANGGDLAIGTWTNNSIHFVVNGSSATSDALTISSSTVTIPSLTLSGSLTAASSSGTNGQYLQSTGTGVQWSTVQSGSQVKLDGGSGATYTYIDFYGFGSDLTTSGTVRVLPLTPTGGDTGHRIYAGTTTPSTPTTGDLWVSLDTPTDADLTTMVIMGAY